MFACLVLSETFQTFAKSNSGDVACGTQDDMNGVLYGLAEML